jgi:hypothetical protein
MKYYKETTPLAAGLMFEIYERGRGAGGGPLARVYDSVFADRIVDLLNEDEAITRLIGDRDAGTVAAMLETALKSDA